MNENRSASVSDQFSVTGPHVTEKQLEQLDAQPLGQGFQGLDIPYLALLGLVLPAIILVWGWL